MLAGSIGGSRCRALLGSWAAFKVSRFNVKPFKSCSREWMNELKLIKYHDYVDIYILTKQEMVEMFPIPARRYQISISCLQIIVPKEERASAAPAQKKRRLVYFYQTSTSLLCACFKLKITQHFQKGAGDVTVSYGWCHHPQPPRSDDPMSNKKQTDSKAPDVSRSLHLLPFIADYNSSLYQLICEWFRQ